MRIAMWAWALISLLGCNACRDKHRPPAAARVQDGGAPTRRSPPEASSAEALGRAVGEDLAAGLYSAVVARFDKAMRGLLTEGALKDTLEKATAGAGPYQRVRAVRVQSMRGREVAFVELVYARAVFVVTVSRTPGGEVGALYLRPLAEPVKPVSASPLPANVEAHDVVVGTAPWALPATLTVKRARKTRVAGVVLVHGSGPNDRDGTVGAHTPLRDLAHGLSAVGFAVLRYEKRTFAHGPAVAATRDTLTVKEEVQDDALAAVAWLRRRPEVDPARVFLLGHSLGGMLALRIAAMDGKLAGVIIAAGSPRGLEDIYATQLRYLALLGGNRPEALQAIAVAEAGRVRVKSATLNAKTPASELPLGLPGQYWLDLRDNPPAKFLGQVKCPLLLLQGGRDYRITDEDLRAWRVLLGARPGVVYKRYPNAGHTFVDGQGVASPQDYQRAAQVSPAVIADVAAFMSSPSSAR